MHGMNNKLEIGQRGYQCSKPKAVAMVWGRDDD